MHIIGVQLSIQVRMVICNPFLQVVEHILLKVRPIEFVQLDHFEIEIRIILKQIIYETIKY